MCSCGINLNIELICLLCSDDEHCDNCHHKYILDREEDTSDAEVWKISSIIPLCSVSSYGRVKYITTDKIIKPYMRCDIRVNSTNYTVSRLIATEFCDNPENKHIVDHIDHDPTNNNYTNLRFATAHENALNSGHKFNRPGKWKGVRMVDLTSRNKYQNRMYKRRPLANGSFINPNKNAKRCKVGDRWNISVFNKHWRVSDEELGALLVNLDQLNRYSTWAYLNDVFITALNDIIYW